MKPTLLCIASYFKGARLMEAAHAAGAHVILVTNEKLKDKPWPMDAIDERFLVPDVNRQPDITNSIAYLARSRRIDRIVALDEYDTVTAAEIREHLRIPGLGGTTGRHFRDKLAMRMEARDAGIPVPEFVHALNDQAMVEFMESVGGPWLLKPRTEASAMGIRKINSSDELWPALDELGDRRQDFLLEAFLPGNVYHVDSIVSKGEICFASPQVYGRPPLDVYQGGGVFVTKTVRDTGDEYGELIEMNERLIKAFGMKRGATHAEFIRSEADGSFYFLEIAARVGGAHIDLLVEAATGVNLWEEWARVEMADVRGEEYTVSTSSSDHAGLLVCLAKEEFPSLGRLDAPEVAWRLHKAHHAGLIVSSSDADRVEELIDEYSRVLATDYMAVAPPLSGADELEAVGE